MRPADVLRRRLGRWIQPETVYAALVAQLPEHVWRDRGIRARSGVSFIGWPGEASGTLEVAPRCEPSGEVSGEVFSALREAMSARLERCTADSDRLGWWGWIGYELSTSCVELPVPQGAGPLAVQLFVDRGIAFDHASGEVTLEILAGPDAAAWLDDTVALLRALRAPSTLPGEVPSAAPNAAPGEAEPIEVSWRHDREGYLDMIAACQDAIARGDAYQLCLTNQAQTDPGQPVDPLATIRRLRRTSPAPQAGVVRCGEHWLVCASPEQFLAVDASGHAATSPIKGTRRRGTAHDDDARLVEELRGSVKERAENLMIVDLMRNDLSRVSQLGSVDVTRLFAVESYPSVHQLVSTVEADLEVAPLAALAALLPPGSMTGAPKRSAVAQLRVLERGPRGAYSGVWGRCSVDGSVELAVVIRSIEIVSGRATIGAGGGITALSDPAEEWDEVMLKAGPLLAALGARASVGAPPP